MNASALLTSQGWLGPGHALDSRLTDYGAQTYKQKGHRGLAYDPNQKTSLTSSQPVTSGNGLIRPLLISQRHGSKRGIGKKAHEPASGNEWWLKGFASALANVGKSESERSSAAGSGASTPRHGPVNGYTGKHSGLYSYFTASQVMKGTLNQADPDQDQQAETTSASVGTKRRKKRKSDVLDEPIQDGGLSNKRAEADPLAVAPVTRVESAREFEKSIAYLVERDRERRPAHHRVKSNDLEQFAAIGQFMEVMEGGEEQIKKKQPRKGHHAPDENLENAREESKEERRARRRRRKEEKDVGSTKKKGALSLAQMVEEELAKLSSVDNSDQETHGSSNIGHETVVEKAKGRRSKKV